jgi:B9 domain-containing protein 2
MSEPGISRRAARKQAINNQRSRDRTEDVEGGEGEGVAMTETKPGDDDAKASMSSNVDDKGGDMDAETMASGNDNNSLAESKTDSGGRAGRRQRRNEGSSSGGADDDVETGDAKPDANATYGPLRVLEPIRQDPIKKMQAYKKKKMERLTANSLPEVHFVGQIVSGVGLLGDVTEGATCRWKVDAGKAWELLGGEGQGQTQVSYARHKDTETIPFNHPIDLHFAEAGLQGWGAPRISFQAYRVDMFGRKLLQGYGFEHLPMTPGPHRLEVNLWRPTGTAEQELDSFMLGRTPALVNHEPMYESAWRERCRLVTVAAGKVFVDVMVVTRNTDKVGLD